MGQEPTQATATAALTNAPFGTLILDAEGRVAWLNSALENLLNLNGKTLLGQSATTADPAWRDLVFSPEDIQYLEATASQPGRWLQTWRVAAQSGITLHYYADITDLQNTQEERDRLQEELAQHNTRDTVTGLPNRQALLQGLEPLVSRSRRYHNPLSVIRLRLENLGDLDAEYGKGSGETTLTAIAHMLKDQLRWADLIGRFDTDEFLLVLPETEAAAADHLLTKLRERLANLAINSKDDRTISFVTQLGAASWEQGDDRAKLLRRAREQLEQES